MGHFFPIQNKSSYTVIQVSWGKINKCYELDVVL